jgi:4-amino-4-deoxy-L-arabinose transferase-like glycosyltransferase
MIGFFPWSCFLPLAIDRLVRRLASRDGATTREADMFVACWAGAYLTFFSFAGTKLPSYVLPCYPALAIITGYFENTSNTLPGSPRHSE